MSLFNFVKKHKVLSIIVGVLLLALIGWLCSTAIAQLVLRNYIKSFSPVIYENQLIPQIEGEGYYTFRTDEDFRIMQINDIHLGGGMATLKKDKKTVYEVMTMVQQEKPDLIILNGDSVFAVPSIVFNGGGTFNNKMVSKEVILMFETLETYFSVCFGNHDTEAFDLTNRKNLGKLYMSDKYKYCIFHSDYDGYGVTNQCILLKDSRGNITKALMLIDSNDYIDNSIASSINWRYDTINDSQVEWAVSVLDSLSGSSSKVPKSFFFFHIPIGEFVSAYRDLEASGWKDTEKTQYVSGVWDELVDEEMGERIWYGGCCQTNVAPEDVDGLFEAVGPDGLGSAEAVFCGHDHVNNGTVVYRGVTLCYGNSIDNIAYSDIALYGIQRGCTVITVSSDGQWSVKHKNAYLDYSVDPSMYFDVNLTDWFYEGKAPY